MALPESRYLTSDYLAHNPTWDREDSPWKAQLVHDTLQAHEIVPVSLCEVGCGAGGVLAALRGLYPRCKLSGYDIAPDATGFWQQYVKSDIEFRVGDFLEINKQTYEVLLLLDVIEHLENPFGFLERLHGAATYFLLIIPLDLSALNVLREKPLLNQRRNVGHIHYFTKDLALSLLRECGYEIISWHYSGAAFHSPQRTWRTRLASFPRRIAYFLGKDWGVRALGGETLIVLASSAPGAVRK